MVKDAACRKALGLSVRLRKISQMRPMMPGSLRNMTVNIT